MSNELKAAGWTDISVPIREDLVHWPGDPPFHIERTSDMTHGDSHNFSMLHMGAHTGTHIDAPLHFINNGMSIDAIPLDILTGRARILEINSPETIDAADLAALAIKQGERLLFKTRNSTYAWHSSPFIEDYVHITVEAARYLVDRRVSMVGIDYLSIGGFQDDGIEVHRILLKAGIWIIEGLDLSAAAPGEYELVCLPLRILKSEGAPARAIIRPLQK